MTKLPFKQHIADLALILKQLNIRHVIICPGSRNAPLIQVFERDKHFMCYSLVDERSASYVALGMARELNEPVLIATTSGTATLNLAPAVAEAFFQHIPLIVLTADRPEEWPPQFGNQRIHQENIFGTNVKDSWHLPVETENVAELKNLHLKLASIIGSASSGNKGPVHLNIPFQEPLYETLPQASFNETLNLNHSINSKSDIISKENKQLISNCLLQGKKVLLIAGMSGGDESVKSSIESLSSLFRLATIAENISNLLSTSVISTPELVFTLLSNEDGSDIEPDLVLIFGGQVVSKRTRLYIQKLKKEKIIVLEAFPNELFTELIKLSAHNLPIENSYLKLWKTKEKEALAKSKAYMQTAEFCNFSACLSILDQVPENASVHLGNSGTIRYSQLIPARTDLKYYSNRGTSGIDGSVSSAVGAAMVSSDLHILIVGDLSFVYDSNALWNRNLPKNLKIIVLNDGGGGIFRLIDGPDRMSFFEEFSVTSHPVSIKQLALAFGVKPFFASDYSSLHLELEQLLKENKQPCLLELETGKSENSRIFKQFYKSIQQ